MRLLIPAILLIAACDTADPELSNPISPLDEDWIRGSVIYELFVPDFTEAGTFEAIVPRLRELRELGITTLWLMPIHPIGMERRKGILGSPYAVRNYYEVNPEYGSLDSFKAFVEAAHTAGIRVILDFVANHTAWDHPWTTAHSDWYTRDEHENLTVPRSPDGVQTNWTDVADLNYDNADLRREMLNVLRYWVEEYGVDGFRCDVAEWVPYDFWVEAIQMLRELRPVLMLAEGADPALHEAGFDLTYAWPFYGMLKEVWAGKSAALLRNQVHEQLSLLPEGAARLRFTTNHDETAWDRTPPQIFGGQQGARAASLVAHTLPGAPLIYNGQELGWDVPVSFFEKTRYDWTKNPDMRSFFGSLFNFYADSEALQSGSLTFLSDSDDLMVFKRESENEEVAIAVNLRPRSVSFAVPARTGNGDWADVFRGETVIAGQTIALAPYGYRLLY